MIMTRPMWLAVVTISIIFVTASITSTEASHHFESSLSVENPAFDLTDLYVFQSSNEDHTTFIMNVNPGVGSDGAGLFGENGVYSFHISEDKEITNGKTITISFSNDVAHVGLLDGVNGETGSEGQPVGSSAIETTTTFENGMKFWAGPAHDPFMGNAVGIQKFVPELNAGTLDLDAFDNKEDFFADRMIASIVVEVPNTMLNDDIYVYATTALEKNFTWYQINRAANPLITHLFMGNDPVHQLDHVQHRPTDDFERKAPISAYVLRAGILSGEQGDDAIKRADDVADKLLPDMIGYKVGTDAKYETGSMGGRMLQDDVMDTVLSLLVGKTITDGANDNTGRYQNEFPYVVPATILENKTSTDDKEPKEEMMTEETSKTTGDEGGGCLIATAAYGTELAPQVQLLREIRDNTIMSTVTGTTFMTGFNQFYYSFSPTIADMERQNPIFQDVVRVFITPMISTLSIMSLAEDGSEVEVLGLGISVIALNLGMYVAAPALVGFKVHNHFKSRNHDWQIQENSS